MNPGPAVHPGPDEVAVTGLGVICCLGRGVGSFWRGMLGARSAPVAAPDPDANVDLRHMYLAPDPPAPRPSDGAPAGRASGLALAAAQDALADAGLAGLAGVDPGRVAVVLGTGMGDSGLHEQWHVDGYPAGGSGWSPVFAPAARLGARFGCAGPNISVSNACAASGFGISVAADLIRDGAADVVLAGGAEAYSRIALGCFNRLGAVDAQRCRPFDRHRAGTVFGEGAAVLILESARHAAARTARRYAGLAGAGWSCDAHHQTAPEPAGEQIVRAMRQALTESGVGPDGVGCVVPHGTGTRLNDVVESRALGAVLGHTGTPLYSLKALIGHTGGAAGAFAAVAAVLMLARGTVPPNVALDEPDPECDVSLPGEPARLARAGVLVNAYAFGGNNVSLLFRAAA